MKDIIEKEMRMHPKAQPQDILKLLIQSYIGPAHSKFDSIASLAVLLEEKEVVHMSEDVTYIGNGLCRVPISFMRKQDIPLWNLLFLSTMRNVSTKEKELKNLLDELSLTMTFDKVHLESIQQGIHHSDVYRMAYDPHYRVIKQAYVDYFEVILNIYKKQVSQHDIIIAIEGRCASGKSFLAALLMEVFDANLFHVDDFFLQPFQRTKQRLEKIGGNVDYERLEKEILEPLQKHDAITYQVYDCQHGSLKDEQTLPYQPLTIIEGSYSQHPLLKEYMDIRIFLTLNKEEQQHRLKNRSAVMYQRFIDEWIPKEEAYFSYYQINKEQDIILDTSTFLKII